MCAHTLSARVAIHEQRCVQCCLAPDGPQWALRDCCPRAGGIAAGRAGWQAVCASKWRRTQCNDEDLVLHTTIAPQLCARQSSYRPVRITVTRGQEIKQMECVLCSSNDLSNKQHTVHSPHRILKRKLDKAAWHNKDLPADRPRPSWYPPE